MEEIHVPLLLHSLIIIVKQRRSQQARVQQVLTNLLLIFQFCGALRRLEVVAGPGHKVKVGLQGPPLVDFPELLCSLVLVPSYKHLGASGVHDLGHFLVLFINLLVCFVNYVLFGHDEALVIVLKNVVEAAHFCLVLADVVAAHHSERLHLLLLELQHRHGALLVVVDQDLEVRQIVGLDNTILEFDENLLLILLELRELYQVTRLDPRTLQDLALQNFFWKLSQVKLVEAHLLEKVVKSILNRNRKVKLQFLLKGGIRQIRQLLLQPIILQYSPRPFLNHL